MRKKKKSKKVEISAEDTLRAFVTVHVNDEIEKITAADRADLVDTIVELFGPAITLTVKGAIAMLTEDSDSDDDEDEDDEDEDEDEDEDVE